MGGRGWGNKSFSPSYLTVHKLEEWFLQKSFHYELFLVYFFIFISHEKEYIDDLSKVV